MWHFSRFCKPNIPTCVEGQIMQIYEILEDLTVKVHFFTYSGEWNPFTNYNIQGMFVTLNGSSYVKIIDGDSINFNPSLNPQMWQLVAAKGEQGDIGPAGQSFRAVDGLWDADESIPAILTNINTGEVLTFVNAPTNVGHIVINETSESGYDFYFKGSDTSTDWTKVLDWGGVPGPQGGQGPQGARGDTGLTPNFTTGTVQTLPPNMAAYADITGTPENPVLNLGIPKGDAGVTLYEHNIKILIHDADTPQELRTNIIIQIINTDSALINSFQLLKEWLLSNGFVYPLLNEFYPVTGSIKPVGTSTSYIFIAVGIQAYDTSTQYLSINYSAPTANNSIQVISVTTGDASYSSIVDTLRQIS